MRSAAPARSRGYYYGAIDGNRGVGKQSVVNEDSRLEKGVRGLSIR